MKHALIIGGSKGTGKVIAQMFSNKGYNVSVIARSQPDDVDDVGFSNNILYRKIDFENYNENIVAEELNYIVNTNGPLNYVVFCQRFRGKEDSWKNELNISLNATKSIVDYIVSTPNMLSDGDKSFVVLSSVASRLTLYQQPASYHVAKAGMETLMDYYAVTLAPRCIRFNSILPGTFVKPESKDYYSTSKEKSILDSTVPLGRMLNSDDIANVTEFLCDEKSFMLTGQKLILDGGISLIGQESLVMKLLK